jgi:two-component system LytT family sensor kinase
MPFSKFSKIIVHIIGWLLLFSLIIVFTYTIRGGENTIAKIFSPQNLLFYTVYIFLFYLNSNVLMPFLYLRKKHFYYGVVIIALLIAIYFLRPFDRLLAHSDGPFHEFRPPDMPGNAKPQPGPRSPGIDIVSIILFITILSVSTVISIIKEWQSTLQRATRAEADKAQAELSFLKAQINPHFLFNTLNNIYSLAVTKNDDTSFAIMKLSNIMRYVTDDATHDFVLLQSEVDCISDYIDLQRLRLNKKTEIDFSVTGNIDDKQIAPLLLITFVENVFKYGVSSHESSSVTIKLSADEKTITLFCQNKLFQSMRRIERTGIGLSNTKQRLEFLYPKRHSLNITTENGLYTVLLTLQV